jgi:hypothetical protein
LAAALRAVGVDALAIDLDDHPFRYEGYPSAVPPVVRLAQWARRGRRNARAHGRRRHLWAIPWIATSLLVLAWAALRYDVFVFGFGQTFLKLNDLPLLRRLGKRLIFVFNGSDARPPYIDGVRMAPERALPIAQCSALTRQMKADLGRIERHADVIVAQPAFSHFFEQPVVNFFVLGLPWRTQPDHHTVDPIVDGTIRILHSPSDPVVKGSARIREVVDALRREGIPVELVELRGVPNRVVLRELRDCDFAIDQIYSDAPMVGFATEAAVAGKPTVVGGYAWPENHRVFGTHPMPPVAECAPDDLESIVRDLALDPGRRVALGRAARSYVEEQWSMAAIGARLAALIAGPPPADWLFDPRDLRYVEGCGLTRDQARALIAAMVREGGRAALCLADKPALEERFVAFAREGSGPG